MSELNAKDDFLNLSTKFLFINFDTSSVSDKTSIGERNSKSNNIEDLNHLLNELNSLDYKNGLNIVDIQSSIRLLQSLPNISANEETLVVKACCLITSMVKHQKLKLTEHILGILIDWLLKALNLNYNSIVCDIFDTLRVLIKGNSDKIAKFYDVLFSPEGLLTKSLFEPSIFGRSKKSEYETNSTEDIKLSALLCVEAFLMFSEETIEISISSDYILYIGNNVLTLIYEAKPEKYGESNYNSLITSALSVCRIICWKNKNWANEKIGEILGAARAFILYKIPNADSIAPQKIISSQQSVLESKSGSSNTGGKVAKTRKPKHFTRPKRDDNKGPKTGKIDTLGSGNEDAMKMQDLSALSPFYRTSDSDYSETEANRVQFDRKKQSKVRESALTLIGNLAKAVEKRVFFGYWHSMFPLNENPENMDHIPISLLNSVLKDSAPNCRISALRTISVIFYGSKSYLTQVDMSNKGPSTYTPFSVALGNMVTMIYTNIIEALSNEGSLPVVMQILKCLTILIQATPINRLKFDIIKNLVFFIRRLICHKDSSIQVAALMVMGIIISTPEITLDILEIVGIQKTSSFKIINTSIQSIHTLQTSQLEKTEYDDDEIISDDEIEADLHGDDELKKMENSGVPKMSWLLHRVLENLGIVISPYKNRDKIIITPAPVRIESLQVLSAMSVYYILLKDHLNFIASALNFCLACDNNEIRLSSGKCLESIGHGISAYLLNHETVNQDDLNAALNFWLTVLPLVIEQIQNLDESCALKSVCCDALSNIGVHVFEKLPGDKHITLISLLAATAYSDDSIVKAAAVRALAVYSLFPSLKEDLCFIENTAESIILLMGESNLQVRIKASWSLGNITDALISSTNYTSNEQNFADSHLERINDDLLRRLIEVSSQSSDQVDRVRSNIMRSMGNLLKLLANEHLKQKLWADLFLAGINKIIINGLQKGHVKVKWNACYAIGNILKNKAIYEMSSIQKWQSLVYPALCNIILSCNNFKVRTNGVIAMTIPFERKHYGTFYSKVWNTLLLALEQSDDLIDFNEYKHRDNLMDQLCLSLSHLLDLMGQDDILAVVNDLIPKIDTIKGYWIRVINRLVPEKVAPLLATTLKLDNYDVTKLNAEQKSGIKTLCFCFVPATEYI